MVSVSVVLWVAALICFGLAAISVASRVNLVALGLFLLTLGRLWP